MHHGIYWRDEWHRLTVVAFGGLVSMPVRSCHNTHEPTFTLNYLIAYIGWMYCDYC